MARTIVDRLAEEHGGVVGTTPINPTVEVPNPDYDPVLREKSGPRTIKVPNPNPTYRFVFTDGTEADIRTNDDGSLSVVDPGTALKTKVGAKDIAPKYYETDEGIVEVTPSGPRDPYQDMEAGAVGIPTQPTTGGARLVYNDPNADIRRKQADADLQYKLRQLALLGAPPQRTPRGAEEIELDQLRAEELRQKLARYDEETAWKRAWDQRQEEGLNARQQMSTSGSVFGNMGNLWQEAMKWAVPASGIPVGFEADSNYGRLLGSMIPGGYKPPQLPPVAFNPEALWKRAVGMVGGK